MTTQTATAYVSHRGGALKFTATCTDDAATALVSAGGQQLGAAMAGVHITGATGEYAAGGAIFRVKKSDGTVVRQWPGEIISKGGGLQWPIGLAITPDMVVEAITVAVPT